MYECLRLKLRAMVSPPVNLHGQTRNMCGTESQVLAKQTVHVTLPVQTRQLSGWSKEKKNLTQSLKCIKNISVKTNSSAIKLFFKNKYK